MLIDMIHCIKYLSCTKISLTIKYLPIHFNITHQLVLLHNLKESSRHIISIKNTLQMIWVVIEENQLCTR